MPVLAGFFIMGLCDMVAPVSGRIAEEFPAESQGAVSFLPSMVFLWFLLLSTPFASLMNRWGRKTTATVGYAFTVTGMMIPYLAGRECSLIWYFVGFGLLGVGNIFVQVAINPLLATSVPSNRMTSFLTVGQIFRNIALLIIGPLVTVAAAWTGSWKLILPIYGFLTILGGVWLQMTSVPEPEKCEKVAGVKDCFRLLKNSRVLMSAIGIGTFIAADVAINFVAVRLIDNPSSILTSTGFYASRILGTLIGAWVLAHYSDVKYLRGNMLVALVLIVVLLLTQNSVMIYVAMAVMGFVFACVFATFYAVATKAVPDKANEVAGLMIMMISSGAISGPVCESLIQWTGNTSMGFLFPLVCIVYMLVASLKLDKNK